MTLGAQQQSVDGRVQQRTAATSTVGSVAGDVTLIAGQSYSQRGSDVLAPGGDVGGTGSGGCGCWQD